jgi:Capsule assembly protein Wzi/PAP2 superfamily
MFSIRSVMLAIVIGGLVMPFARAQDTASAQTDHAASPDERAAETSTQYAIADNKHAPDVVDEDAKYELAPGEDPNNHLFFPVAKHLLDDQRAFWTAPVHFRVKDLEWGVPFAGITAAFIASDSWWSKQIPLGEISRSKTISDYGTYSFIGAGAGGFVLGHMTGNDRMAETGLLSGEAAIDSTAIAFLFETVTQRPRPYQDNGDGTFFKGGASFPSEHSAIAWSVASIMAHEYPGTFTKALAYGLATAVSATRVTGQQHFPSDVIIGGALGWYFGRQVYRSHHDTDLGGEAWGNFSSDDSGERTRNPANMGSPYVPLDSWIYPALERLAALGYIKSAYLGIRPWTRLECARMLDEAQQAIADEDDQSSEAEHIYTELANEFAPETRRLDGAANVGASLDSIYAGATNISGRPLIDGYHFGQTVINDYGRPYGEGFNSVDGFTSHAEAGPFAFYVRGEYQHSPSVPSYSPVVQEAIYQADFTCQPPPTPSTSLPCRIFPSGHADVNRFDLLEGTVSVTWRNTQLSFGKQSQWLGPGESGALLMSDNAEPVLMLKLDNVSPYEIPLLSHVLGPVRAEYFLGQLAGQQFELDGNTLLGPGGISPQPFFDGGKFSFKPTPNLEMGMGFTAQFAGPGLPFTFSEFFRTFYVHTQSASTTAGSNPAKRATNADFSYRVPGLRNWLAIYGDALTVDEVSPIGSTRATVNPGVYVPQFPKLHNLQFRAEGIHEPLTREFAPGFVYYSDDRYRSGYTNDGNLMGNWIGRAGRGAQSWLTYSLTPRSQLQFGYRLQEVSHLFLGGGRSTDFSAAADIAFSHQLSASAFVQYEQWRFPLIAANMQSDITVGFQLTFRPNVHIQK